MNNATPRPMDMYFPWEWNNGFLEDSRGALRVDVNPYSEKVEGGASEKDKDFLLRAVNNHEALLEACKQALDEFTSVEGFYHIKGMLRRAIKNAEKEG